MSTTLRQYWLKALRVARVRNFRAKSGLGLPYVCHVGDFAGEAPFYYRPHSVREICLMAEWCRNFEKPIIFDVGANNGFVATQLAQVLLKDCSPRIYAFEPVPSTFCQLRYSIEKLQLGDSISEICCAVSDLAGINPIAYNPAASLFAQIRQDGANSRVGSKVAICATLTVDEIVKSLRMQPSLIKVDVEGFEVAVLRGAAELLRGGAPPAICFEWNPLTMAEMNVRSTELPELLSNYQLYYVDDFEGQRFELGKEVPSLSAIKWVCNIFAVPSPVGKTFWDRVFNAVRSSLH